jgi:hypothetical protein
VLPGLLLFTLLLTSGAFAENLGRTAFSNGAVEAAGGSYRVRATFGEVGFVGLAVGPSHVMGSGFWPGHALAAATDAPDPDVSESVIAYVDGLRQNFPNPFRRSTDIAYTVGQPARVRLAVYDVAGRYVATLTDVHRDPGSYRVRWEGRSASGERVASGVYFYRLDIGSWSSTRKLLKLH